MYERTFGTDWTTLDDREEVVRRAFALGVSARLGADDQNELDRLSEQVGTSYNRSLVRMAYQEGRTLVDRAEADDDEGVWEELVEEPISIDPRRESLRSRTGPDVETAPEGDTDREGESLDDRLPGALRRPSFDSRPGDTTELVARPSVLDREPDAPSGGGAEGERTVFGRPRGRNRRDHRDDTPSRSEEGDGSSRAASGEPDEVSDSDESDAAGGGESDESGRVGRSDDSVAGGRSDDTYASESDSIGSGRET